MAKPLVSDELWEIVEPLIHQAFLSIACSLICLKRLQAGESFC